MVFRKEEGRVSFEEKYPRSEKEKQKKLSLKHLPRFAERTGKTLNQRKKKPFKRKKNEETETKKKRKKNVKNRQAEHLTYRKRKCPKVREIQRNNTHLEESIKTYFKRLIILHIPFKREIEKSFSRPTAKDKKQCALRGVD